MDSLPPSPGSPSPDQEGNYDSPALAELRRVWDDYCAEQAAPEQVIGVIAEVGNFAHFQIQQLEAQVKRGESNPEDPAFSLILEAFEVLLEGCEAMAWEFTSEIPEDVEEPEEGFFAYGYDLCQEATNQMLAGHKLAMEHIEAMARVACPFCQRTNSRENAKCDNCGRALPPSADAGAGLAVNLVEHQGLDRQGAATEGEFTRNHAMTVQILEAWKKGSVSAEELEQFLDQLEQNFSAHWQETERQGSLIERAPAQLRGPLQEALELTRDGIEKSLRALETMRSAFDQEDDRYLFFGLSELEDGSRLLVQAYWANKKAAG